MAKKIPSFLVTALVRGCVIFTVLSVFLYVGAYLFVNNTDALTLSRVVNSLIFSLVAGVMTAFLTTNVMNVAVRAVLHYAVTLAAFIVLFSLIPGSGLTGNAVMTGAVYTVFWAVPFAIWIAIRSGKARKKNAKEEYTSAFGGKKTAVSGEKKDR